MLDPRDISKFRKPFIIALTSKTVIFLVLLIFLAAQSLTGFEPQNLIISDCDGYINLKNSKFNDKMLAAQFIMTVSGLATSGLSLGLFSSLLILFRKEQKQKLSQKKRLSQNRIKAHFVLTFIEAICSISIFFRSIQKIGQRNFCNLENKGSFIAILSLSIIILLIVAFTTIVLFRFLSMIREKQRSLEEFTFYSDQITLQENLLFNKTGYIKELLKIEDYTSRSSSMKEDLIKSFPSGYKKNDDLSPKRQIVYRLLGGNITSSGLGMNTLAPKKIPQEEGSGEFNTIKQGPQVGSPQEQNNPLKLNLMAVGDKTQDETPNDQNYQYVELTNNVIDLSVQKGIFEDLNEESEYDDEQEEKSESFSSPRNGMRREDLNTAKEQKDIQMQMKLQQQLKQKFNLTSNADARRRYVHRRNQQNIDDYGNYFYVDVEKIKKRSKLLKFQKINEEASNVDPNTLYAKSEFIPHQKRLGKKHQKYVADYLNKLNKLKKQEMLYQEESSSYSENFDEQSEESSDEEEESSSYQEIDPTSVAAVDPVTGQPMTVMPERKKKPKHRGPQLYLYIKKKKVTGKHYKLKLYDDEEGFYDSEDSKQNAEGEENGIKGLDKGLENNLNGQKMAISGVSKQHHLEKSKHEQKVILTNKYLDNDEARMLRFIRRKYIIKQPEYQEPQLGMIFQPNANKIEDYNEQGSPIQYQNPNPYQNMSPPQNMNPPMKMTQYPNQPLGQYQNPQQNPYSNPQQYQMIQPFEGNILVPPLEDQMAQPSNQQKPLPYNQISPNPQPSPGFPTPFYMQTPPSSNQTSYGYHMPLTHQQPTNK